MRQVVPMTKSAKGVSFGFGTARGQVFKNPDLIKSVKTRDDTGLILDYVPDTPEIEIYKSSELIQFLIVPEVSPYSHRAIKFWDSGMPILSLSSEVDDLTGVEVYIDFDAGEIVWGSISEIPITPHDPEQSSTARCGVEPLQIGVSAEVSSRTQLEMISDSPGLEIGVIKGEFLLQDMESAAWVASLVKQRSGRSIIRFPDEVGYDDENAEFRFDLRGSHRGLQGVWKTTAVRNFASQILGFGFENPVILFPMISRADQIQRARIELGGFDVVVGASIETPAAVINISQILHEVDFVEFGVNDLSQYTMGCNRDVPNPELLPFDSIADEVMQKLSHCVMKCDRFGVSYSVGLDFRPSTQLLSQLQQGNIKSISSGPTLAKRWKRYLADTT